LHPLSPSPQPLRPPVQAALLLLLLGCDQRAPAPVAPPAPTTTSAATLTTGTFTQIAESAGWTVQEGALRFSDYSGCCEPNANCLWNNPSTPYGTVLLPPGPQQAVPDIDIFTAWGPEEPGLSRNFRLRADEAIVWLGPLPPVSEYFSDRSYIATRYAPGKTGLYDDADPILGSLGPSLNHEVIAAQAGPLWAQDVAIVTAADLGVQARVTDWLLASGVAADHIFYDAISSDLVTLGDTIETDTFMGVVRFAVPQDVAAAEAYVADPGVHILRVSANEPLSPEPTGLIALPERGTGSTEVHLEPALDALEAAILDTWPDHISLVRTSAANEFETYTCVENGFCSGEIRDRLFASIQPLYMDLPTSFMVVLGVNHERSGKASYSNFAVDTSTNLVGFTSVNSDEMVGSALAFLPDHPEADDLYAWIISRDCSMHLAHCIQLLDECPSPAPGEAFQVSFRMYLEAATGSAPLPSELVLDRLIKFVETTP
jgi:hypothetical protein